MAVYHLMPDCDPGPIMPPVFGLGGVRRVDHMRCPGHVQAPGGVIDGEQCSCECHRTPKHVRAMVQWGEAVKDALQDA